MRDGVSVHPGFLRRLRRLRGDGGFTLIEAVFAMILFAGLAAAMAGLLTSAITANNLARQRTLADQAAMEQIESIRRLDYDDVGTILGNPPGTVAPTSSVNLTGLDATVTVQIRYVDDPTPTSYETSANYKRVMVSIRRDSDNRLLAREVTYVAPTSRTPFGGVNLAIVHPLVIDYGLNVPVEGVTVNLLTGPSAPRSDTTDDTGQVIFQKLDPNATATCPSDCYDLTAVLSGYEQLDAPTRLNVGPGQTGTPTIQIYRPGTINVVLQDTGGAPYTGTASVKLTSARNGATETFTVSGGSATITAVNGESIVPSVQYTAEGFAPGGTPACASPVTQYVPDNYPTVLSTTFTLTMAACPSGDVDVTVNWGGPAPGATVTLSGGPYSLPPVTGTTNSSGQVSFSNVPSGAGYTVEASMSGTDATPQTVSVTTGSTTNVTFSLPTATVIILVRNSSGTNQTNGAGTARIKLGPMSIDVTGTTNSTGRVTFTNVPVGTGYTLQAWRTGCGGFGSKSRQLTGRTVNTGTNNFTLQWNSSTCPLT
jgi:type II secretory pathway pseudopilin PulG